MKRLLRRVASFGADDSAVTSIEYALIAVLIAVVIAGVVGSAGLSLKTFFTNLANCFPSGAC